MRNADAILGAEQMKKDFEIENEKMYTIREAAEICGVSRATLLRMEEGGFDSPRLVDEKNGYRYYDVVNIHRIKLYQMLQIMGLSNKEIHAYFDNNLAAEDFLAVLYERLAVARRCVEEFEARLIVRGSTRYEYVTLPAVECYTYVAPMKQPKDQIEFNYRKIQEIYAQGYKPAAAIPMFSIAPGVDEIYGNKKPTKEGITIAIVVDSGNIPDVTKITSFPTRRAFSLLYKGNNDEIMQSGGDILLEEMKQRGLEPKGPCYGICILGPFYGTQVDPDDYVFRWAIPIE